MKQNRKHRISYIAKRFIIILALICVMVSPMDIGQADAQIFIMSEDEYMNNSRLNPTYGMVPILPQGGQEDWILAPLGDGVLLLLGLGGAYLFGKRRKRETE